MEMCEILSVMYGSSIFSRVFAMTERNEMDLCNVPGFMSLLGFSIGMMFASFHMCGMMLFSDMLYMLVRCESKRSDIFEVPHVDFIRSRGVAVNIIVVVCSMCYFLSMCYLCCIFCD